jgi:acylphosphatase
MPRQWHFYLSGHVQGVGLRYMVRQQCQVLKIVGFVRNLTDGSVEVVCQGSEQQLELLEKWLAGKYFSNNIQKIIKKEEPNNVFDDFRIML